MALGKDYKWSVAFKVSDIEILFLILLLFCLAKVALIWLSQVQKRVPSEVGQTINFMAKTTEYSKTFSQSQTA